ncbi:MAG: glycosyltransferase [Actinobacteria bacterium]|nr:glycosyltransferase [Actinomycetota bacterium]
MPSISVIISFYNRIDYLRLVFASLERQTYDNFEVIIADDGSEEAVKKEVGKLQHPAPFRTQYIWQEDLGFRKNKILNRAITAAKSPYLIFIDGDCILHKEFIREHYDHQEQKVCLTGRRVNLSHKISSRITPRQVRNSYMDTHFRQFFLNSICGKTRYAEKGLYISNPLIRRLINKKNRTLLGSNFSLHKSDLLDINGFDERYELPSIGEDTDLEYRLNLNGVKTHSLNNIAIQYHLYHPVQPRLQENLELFYNVQASDCSYTPFGINQIHCKRKKTHAEKNNYYLDGFYRNFIQLSIPNKQQIKTSSAVGS